MSTYTSPDSPNNYKIYVDKNYVDERDMELSTDLTDYINDKDNQLETDILEKANKQDLENDKELSVNILNQVSADIPLMIDRDIDRKFVELYVPLSTDILDKAEEKSKTLDGELSVTILTQVSADVPSMIENDIKRKVAELNGSLSSDILDEAEDKAIELDKELSNNIINHVNTNFVEISAVEYNDKTKELWIENRKIPLANITIEGELDVEELMDNKVKNAVESATEDIKKDVKEDISKNIISPLETDDWIEISTYDPDAQSSSSSRTFKIKSTVKEQLEANQVDLQLVASYCEHTNNVISAAFADDKDDIIHNFVISDLTTDIITKNNKLDTKINIPNITTNNNVNIKPLQKYVITKLYSYMADNYLNKIYADVHTEIWDQKKVESLNQRALIEKSVTIAIFNSIHPMVIAEANSIINEIGAQLDTINKCIDDNAIISIINNYISLNSNDFKVSIIENFSAETLDEDLNVTKNNFINDIIKNNKADIIQFINAKIRENANDAVGDNNANVKFQIQYSWSDLLDDSESFLLNYFSKADDFVITNIKSFIQTIFTASKSQFTKYFMHDDFISMVSDIRKNSANANDKINSWIDNKITNNLMNDIKSALGYNASILNTSWNDFINICDKGTSWHGFSGNEIIEYLTTSTYARVLPQDDEQNNNNYVQLTEYLTEVFSKPLVTGDSLGLIDVVPKTYAAMTFKNDNSTLYLPESPQMSEVRMTAGGLYTILGSLQLGIAGLYATFGTAATIGEGVNDIYNDAKTMALDTAAIATLGQSKTVINAWFDQHMKGVIEDLHTTLTEKSEENKELKNNLDNYKKLVSEIFDSPESLQAFAQNTSTEQLNELCSALGLTEADFTKILYKNLAKSIPGVNVLQTGYNFVENAVETVWDTGKMVAEGSWLIAQGIGNAFKGLFWERPKEIYESIVEKTGEDNTPIINNNNSFKTSSGSNSNDMDNFKEEKLKNTTLSVVPAIQFENTVILKSGTDTYINDMKLDDYCVISNDLSVVDDKLVAIKGYSIGGSGTCSCDISSLELSVENNISNISKLNLSVNNQSYRIRDLSSALSSLEVEVNNTTYQLNLLNNKKLIFKNSDTIDISANTDSSGNLVLQFHAHYTNP